MRNSIFLLLSILLLLIGQYSAAKRFPSQAQANCYPGCRCNATAVECRNLDEGNTQLFRYVHPEAYPKLDTLVVTGNHFGLLEDENLFGSNNERHIQLTLVNLSSNSINSFGAQTLIGMPRVEYLYLGNNRLDSLDDVQPLNYLTSLKLLDLSKVFGKHISANAKADLLRRLFRNNHSFVDLQEVNLRGNALTKIHPDTFCNIKGLTRLNLADNQLTSFDFNSNCLAGLHVLDLSHNQLQAIPATLWQSLPSLDTIDVSANPLKCDCQLEEFHKFALEEVNSFLNQEATKCASPTALRAKRLFEVDTNFCGVGSRLWHWLFLLCIAGGVLFGYYRFGRGLRPGRIWSVAVEKWERARQNPMRVPLVDNATGYNQLKEDYDRGEDPNVPPAFV